MSVPTTQLAHNRRLGWYQLSPYDKVSRGAKAKFKAGPFYVNNPLSLDQLKLIQYAFDKGGNGRYIWFIGLCIFYSPVHIYWLANTLLLVCVFSEIIVFTNDQFISMHNFMSHLPNTTMSEEVCGVLALTLHTICLDGLFEDKILSCHLLTTALDSHHDSISPHTVWTG